MNRKIGLKPDVSAGVLESLLENTEVSRGSPESPWWRLWLGSGSGKGTEIETWPPRVSVSLFPKGKGEVRWILDYKGTTC